MNKIDILFVIANLNTGGAERVFVNLLRAFDRNKYNCKLILINSGDKSRGSYKLPDNIEVINLQKNRKTAFFSLVKTIKSENPDVVFSNLAPINILCLAAKLVIRNSNTKYIIRETTIKSVSIDNTKQNILFRFIYKSLIKLFYNLSDGIISLSKGAKQDLISKFNIKKDKIKVIYNPIDINDILEKSKLRITDIHISKERVNLICVGSLIESKGHKYLIKAVYKLKMEYGYNIQTYFIGTGKLKTNLKRIIAQYNMEDNFMFLGYQSNPFKYMSRCDIFVLPAIWEGFGNVIVEAMVCNIPVVSTNCLSGPREIINHKINGLLAEPKNIDSLVKFIKILIDNQQYYETIRQKGRERAKDFEINKITKEYENYILTKLE